MKIRLSSRSSYVSFPLTLSLGEREPLGRAFAKSNGVGFAERLATFLPLPKGEGWGEGKETCAPRRRMYRNFAASPLDACGRLPRNVSLPQNLNTP